MSKREKRKGAGVRVAGRFVAGRDLNGGHATDAGWRRKGTVVLNGTGHASRWAHLPHWQRAAVRLGGVSTTGATAVGSLVAPAATWATWQTALVGGATWGGYAVVEKTYRYTHFRQYVQPVGEVVGPRVGWPKTTNPRTWIDVPNGHREDPEKVVELRFPKGLALTETKKKELLGLARPLLGLHGCDVTWTEGGDAPMVQLRAAPTPPELVDLERARVLLEAAPWDAPLIGFTSRSRPVSISYAQDSPHVLASYGSGAGKSVLGKSLAAQFRRHGGRVLIGDCVKRGASHKWAKELDGIEVIRSVGALHDALIALAEEVSDRCELAWHHGEIDRTPLMLVMEESNATANQLAAYWKDELEGKGKSPALKALADVLCVGREAKVHVVTFAQQATAQATGGGAARENYGVRMLSRFTRNTARMLVPELAPHFPRSSRHPGRAQVVMDGEATEVQTLYLSDQQARDLALSGDVPGTFPRDVPAQRASRDGGTPRLELVAGGLEDVEEWTELPEADPLVSIAEAADGMVLEASRDAIAKARTRDPEGFPASRGRRGQTLLYRPAELRAYWANRPGSGALAGAKAGGGDAS